MSGIYLMLRLSLRYRDELPFSLSFVSNPLLHVLSFYEAARPSFPCFLLVRSYCFVLCYDTLYVERFTLSIDVFKVLETNVPLDA